PVEEDPEMAAAAEKDLVRAAANPALGTILSRLTGVLRWGAMAYALGRTGLADAYGIANNTPNIIYELVVGGVLSSTLVPLFVNTRRRTKRGETDDGASAIITVASIALIVLSVIGVLAAPWIARAYTLGLEPAARAAQLELTVPLMRLFLPQIFLYGIVSLATAVLHSQHKLSIPAYTPIANNLVVTAMFIAARPLMERVDNGTASMDTLLLVLGIGTTLGVIAQALPLIAPMRDGVVRLRWNLAVTHPVVKRLIRLSGWTMGYVVANQVSLYVVTNLANSGPEGTVATYQYAFAFFQLPHGLIAVSLMTAVLPRLATAFVDENLDAYRANFREGLNVLFTVVLAASAGYVVVAQPVVQVVFQRGAFSASGTDETARTLIAFAVGLPAFSTYLYAVRAFHARQNTRTPFWINTLENSLNIGLAVLLTTRTASGLALAFSGAYLIAAIIAVIVLNYQVRELVDRSLFTMMAKASAAAGATVLGALLPGLPPLSALDWAPVQLILRVALGAVAFVVAVAYLRIDGLDRYVAVLRRKVGPFLPAGLERLLARGGSDEQASAGRNDDTLVE
ncbi:MAG: murein biosynthesis integral membrane protein MurJ, partial [Microthrixaceae bacterium]|nr:murein biosynthesis integral membrane protein MurJ [Microthrixaceae bacterium]